MNEIALKKLYWELKDRVDSYAKKLATLKGDARTDYEELKDLIKKLEQRAVTASISLDSDEGVGQVADETNDWMQILELSSMPAFIQDKIKNKVKNTTPQYPTGAEMQVLIDNIMKFYNQNTKLKDDDQVYIKILDNVNPERSGLKNYTPAEMASVKADFNEYIIAAIDDGIRGLDSNSWSWQMEDVHHAFEEYYMQRKLVDKEVKQATKDLPYQFKVDIAEKKYNPEYKLTVFSINESSIKANIKGSYFKTAAKSREVTNMNDYMQYYDQYIRTTITTFDFQKALKGHLNPKASTTFFSKGVMVALPNNLGTVTIKCDLINLTWVELNIGIIEEAKRTNYLAPSIGTFSLKYDLELTNKDLPIIDGLTYEVVRATVSVGCKISLTEGYFRELINKAIEKLAEKEAKDKLAKEALKALQNDGNKLISQADDLKGVLDEAINEKSLSQKARAIVDKFDDAAKAFTKKVNAVKGAAKKAAQKIAQETAEAIAKKLGVEAMKRAAILTAGKVLIRCIPVVGQIVTVVEISYYFVLLAGWAIEKAQESNDNRQRRGDDDEPVNYEHRLHSGKL